MKRLLVFILLSLLVTFNAPGFADSHCMDELGCVELGPDDPVVIGAMLAQSGATAFFGEDSLGGIQLAILERGGRLLDREIVLTTEDSLCAAEGGQIAARRVTSDNSVLGIIGTNCTSAAQGALPIVSEAGMLMISPSNAAPSMTNDDIQAGGAWQPGYFRTFPNDLFQAALAAQFAIMALDVKTAATIHDGSDYAESNVSIMTEAFVELGGEVLLAGAINRGDTDISALLTEIAAVQPELLYFPLFPPESEFVAAQMATTPGLEGVAAIASDSSLVADFPLNVGSAAVGVYMTGPFSQGEAYADFLSKWEEEIGGKPPSAFHSHAWDATNLLLDAIESVAQELPDGSLVIGRGALREAIADVEDYPGLSGTLTCLNESPHAGDCASGAGLAIYQMSEEVVAGEVWPPPVVWHLGMIEAAE